MATVRLLSAAHHEVLEAFDWYLERREGAAEASLREVEVSLSGARGSRRYVMRRYPFAVIYRSRGDLVEVVAFAHQRKPGYWQDR